MKILFMCVANSARSQLAEGLARKVFGDTAEIQSAGSRPTRVNPLAIQVMSEIDVDLSGHSSKSTQDMKPEFLADLDYVITLCAEEVCPWVVSKAKKLHWPLPDPAGHDSLPAEDRLALFRSTRDAIRTRLLEFKRELNK